MGKLINRMVFKFILTIIGIFFIGSFQTAFKGVQFHPIEYVKGMKTLFLQILHPMNVTVTTGSWASHYHIVALPLIIQSSTYSVSILMLAFVLAFLLAVLLTYMTMLLPRQVVRFIKFVLFLLESLPDLLVILILQLGIIWFYQKTHFLLLNIVSYGDKNAFWLPVVVLTFLPTLMLFRLMIIDIEYEMNQDYVTLAKGKGLGMSIIILKHILRNALIHLFIDSKYILWFMLSNLVIVEFVFNINGITQFILKHSNPPVITLSLIALFIPLYIVFAIGHIVIEVSTGKELEV